jgi:hypothetical protein
MVLNTIVMIIFNDDRNYCCQASNAGAVDHKDESGGVTKEKAAENHDGILTAAARLFGSMACR